MRACVYSGEPYAPRAQIRTEMVAITVADRWHERDGHIHHPRSFEYRGAERRTRREDDKRGRTGERRRGGREDRRLRRVGRHEKEWCGRRRKIPSSNAEGKERERDEASVRRGRRRERGGKKPVTEEVNTRRWCYPPFLSSSLQSAESLRGSGVWRSWKVSCYGGEEHGGRDMARAI